MAERAVLGLTNIPQDINLTLSSGTLTLKSGSILTAPDGTQTTTAQDYTKTYTTNGQYAVFCAKSSGSIQNPELLSRIGSGSSLPADNTNYTVFYNTTDSKIYRYGTGGWVNWAVCFPIAIITVSDGAISSIDQVFNGFGYIGSDIFALPGVSGFYPDGMDGLTRKYKNVEIESVSIYHNTGYYQDGIMTFFSNNLTRWGYGYEVIDTLPDPSQLVAYKRYYNKGDNKVYSIMSGSLTVNNVVPFCYFTTESSSPYRITSFDVVNPFSVVDLNEISEYSKYLSNLLIIQYNQKPKASQTIQAVGQMFPADLILEIINGFDIETATGKQLDILAKYIGVERAYTDANSQQAMLTDEEFSLLLRLKIIINTGTATLYGLETSLYNFFDNGIQVVDDIDLNGNHTMSLTYFIRADWANVGLAAVQQNCLPHPTGVSVTYSTFTTDPYFGFVTYENQAHPISTGFRDYNNPTKAGQMYSYDKQI